MVFHLEVNILKKKIPLINQELSGCARGAPGMRSMQIDLVYKGNAH